MPRFRKIRHAHYVMPPAEKPIVTSRTACNWPAGLLSKSPVILSSWAYAALMLSTYDIRYLEHVFTPPRQSTKIPVLFECQGRRSKSFRPLWQLWIFVPRGADAVKKAALHSPDLLPILPPYPAAVKHSGLVFLSGVRPGTAGRRMHTSHVCDQPPRRQPIRNVQATVSAPRTPMRGHRRNVFAFEQDRALSQPLAPRTNWFGMGVITQGDARYALFRTNGTLSHLATGFRERLYEDFCAFCAGLAGDGFCRNACDVDVHIRHDWKAQGDVAYPLRHPREERARSGALPPRDGAIGG